MSSGGSEGEAVGVALGSAEGETLGLGSAEGEALGSAEGEALGLAVGDAEGEALGPELGLGGVGIVVAGGLQPARTARLVETDRITPTKGLRIINFSWFLVVNAKTCFELFKFRKTAYKL